MAGPDQRAEQTEEKPRRRREKLASLLMALFPLLVAAGFLAPGIVQVIAVAQETDLGPRQPVVDRLGPYARHPLPLPRDFSSGLVPELLDLDRLFLGSRAPMDPNTQRQVVRLASFPRSHGDAIVLSDVAKLDSDIDFKDVMMDTTLDKLARTADDFTLPMCGALPSANCYSFDDLTSGKVKKDTTPIPEPGTGALLALGLGALAWGARRRAF